MLIFNAMNILYIHQYFRTPDEGGCVRSYHLAKGLVDAGHSVTMITAHNIKNGSEKIDGINVHYLRIPYQNEFGFIRRIIAFLKFVRGSKKTIKSLNRDFDLAYVMTTPLTTGLIALHLISAYGVPYYFEVGDLWPEAPIQMGVIKNRFLQNLLYDFEKQCYSQAKTVIALSPDIKNYIQRVSPNALIKVIPNFSDLEFFDFHPIKKRFNTKNPLKVCYVGTFGQANHLEYLIDAAKACADVQLPVHFTLMGEGKTFENISQLALGYENIKVLPFSNLEEVKVILEQCDASYVSFLNIDVLGTGSPNKFFDGLAAGNMIIVNFGGWINHLVTEKNLGFVYQPEKLEDFANKIKEYIEYPQKLLSAQRNSRDLAEQRFSKALQIRKLIDLVSAKTLTAVIDS
ncbi:MAG: glycosyltransferase family 4 protein [Cyclobacteriaceae bacterium]